MRINETTLPLLVGCDTLALSRRLRKDLPNHRLA